MLTDPREWQLTGLLRSQNRGQNNIHSEETKVIRPYGRSTQSPLANAMEAQHYHDTKSTVLARLHVLQAQNNRKIIRPNLTAGRRLPEGVHPQSAWAKMFANVPSLHVDRKSADILPENQHWRMRDEFGHASGTPQQGSSYVWPNYNYYGNPWGFGGQLYTHLRQGGQQDDGYLYPRKNNEGRDPKLEPKKVQFDLHKNEYF